MKTETTKKLSLHKETVKRLKVKTGLQTGPIFPSKTSCTCNCA